MSLGLAFADDKMAFMPRQM